MLNLLATIILLTCLVSCKQKQSPENVKHKSYTNKTVKKSSPGLSLPDTIYYTANERVNNELFTIATTNNHQTYVLNAKRDTIFKENEYAYNLYFSDFNGDGYKDINIHYRSNTPGIQNLLLYDISKKTYKEVAGISNFPAPQKLGNTKYYYSYYHNGCADYNWVSDLFYIENFKTIIIGNISGHACADTGMKDGIYIYKVEGDKRSIVKLLPINTIKKYKRYKWGFIDHYWLKNYRRFI